MTKRNWTISTQKERPGTKIMCHRDSWIGKKEKDQIRLNFHMVVYYSREYTEI